MRLVCGGRQRARLRAVGAALTRRPDAERDAQVSSTAPERQEIDEAIECIGCGMCLSACTIVAHNGRFPGPAALNRAFTLELDARDGGRQARWRVLLSDDALARCHGQGNCTAVCPMGLAPMRSTSASASAHRCVFSAVDPSRGVHVPRGSERRLETGRGEPSSDLSVVELADDDDRSDAGFRQG